MTVKELFKANYLIQEIKRLRSHLEDLSEILNRKYENSPLYSKGELLIKPHRVSDEKFTLIEECLPTAVEEFMKMYTSQVELRITQLEKQFSEL